MDRPMTPGNGRIGTPEGQWPTGRGRDEMSDGSTNQYIPLAFDTPDCEGVEAKDTAAIVTPGKGTLKFIVQSSFLTLMTSEAIQIASMQTPEKIPCVQATILETAARKKGNTKIKQMFGPVLLQLQIQYCINMGAFLDKPKTEKHNAHGAGNGLRYGLSSMQGWRVEMEDAHTAVDHKPCNPREKERIQNAGGSVMIQRVNGSLAVSRALGDYDYKCVDGKGPTEQLVSPEPEVCEILRADEDEFIILACDGIWDVMSNEELCEFVKSRLEVSDDLEKVCNWVVDTCLHKGSRDNMSIVLVCFSNAPKVSDEAVKKDAELDKYLESRVEEIMEKSGEEGMPDLAHVIRILTAENIPNLPPGGGLAGKRNIIEAVYSRLNPHRENEADPGEAEDSGSQGKLVEALRQMRINHRGNYRHLLEEMLSSYRLAKMQGEESTAESAAASTSDTRAGPSDPVPDTPTESGHHLAEIQSSNEDSGMSDKQT
ncbi:protein phosphatase 1B isoform A [Patagioenas fasciata monilis]|uniref:Protein phosphatase 1B isoform A n=1 Tax=Patagioenas fasciata monilis TaxID=372326 RepID=A0A1V4JJJ0_PATFA|nr:protein phosphatase 1B isoform A [Patagioenas fasciata monilis]